MSVNIYNLNFGFIVLRTFINDWFKVSFCYVVPLLIDLSITLLSFSKKVIRPLVFYFLLFKQTLQFYNKYMGKMPIQFTVLGFKPTTIRT